MQQSAADQIADGSLDPIPLLEVGRVVGHFPSQLSERQRLGVEVEDLTEDGRLVAAVLLGGGRGACIASATRLVVHRELRLLVPCPRLFAQRGGALYGGETLQGQVP